MGRWAKVMNWWLWAALAAGLLLRGWHYVRCPAVWHDEAAMIVNVLQLPPERMTGRLLFDEACPPLFLAVEKGVVAVLGEGEYALRLVPFLAGCGALVITALLARRLLSPFGAAVAVTLFAASDTAVWHTSEAKFYAVDMLVAATAAYAALVTHERPLWVRCLLGAVATPAVVWLSFPACFVLGGVLLALLPVLRTSGWRGWVAYGLFATAVGGSFVALALGPAVAQRTEFMNDCWRGAFADWSRPWLVPVWAVVNTFEVLRYCFMPWGQPLLVVAVLGAWSWWKKPDGYPRLCTSAAPLALAFVAALLGKYPYSAARVDVFAAPGLALLAGEGVARLVEWFVSNKVLRWGLLFWAACVAVPVAYSGYWAVVGWTRAECDIAAKDVLTRRAADEPIYANNAESTYYLRHVDPAMTHLLHSFEQAPDWDGWAREYAARAAGDRPRLWLIHVENPLPHAFMYASPPGYTLAAVRTYRFTYVAEFTPVP